ncbi:MAG TPA: trypsin-like peptidase domain-containing protein [Dehalococcoidia bacterium]|nr:trypsin-like peptidase domain-containing protein [Dehalococcoidia bacterium]
MKFLLPALILCAILPAAACSGDDDDDNATPTEPAEEETAQAEDTAIPVGQPADSELRSVADVVDKLAPSVVTVQTALFDPSSLGDPVPAGAGTGFIWDDEGRIITNFHVIQDPTNPLTVVDEITITFSNGESAEASVVGFDINTDIAVLDVEDAGDLTPAEIGDLEDVAVGDAVIAMGNALNLEGTPTVTTGIVSALGRTINGVTESGGTIGIPDALQTDAAINPGNSGGPLVDDEGRVIGINDQVIRGTETGVPVEGIGFAISIETAQPVIEEIIESGEVNRGFIGIQFVDLTPAVVQGLGLEEARGVAITEIVVGSPADEAGLEENDVIVQIGDVEIEDSGDLSTALLEYRAGDEVEITVIRDGEEETVTLTLGERPETSA